MTGGELVGVDELTVSFGGVTVVDGITFTLARGECLALVGESGSGKSVTTRTLVGLAGFGARVQAARLHLDGADVTRYGERDWRRVRGAQVGFVLQDALASLDPLRPVGKEIAEPLRLHTTLTRAQRTEKVVELLRSVGVPEPEVRAAQYPHQLSGGLRQRALIASAIACGPQLLLADEPTTALDATVQVQVLELLRSLKTADTGLLIVSHDLSVVARLADRVAVLKDGRIVETGPTAQVLGDPQHDYTRALLAAVPSAHAKGTRLAALDRYGEPIRPLPRVAPRPAPAGRPAGGRGGRAASSGSPARTASRGWPCRTCRSPCCPARPSAWWANPAPASPPPPGWYSAWRRRTPAWCGCTAPTGPPWTGRAGVRSDGVPSSSTRIR